MIDSHQFLDYYERLLKADQPSKHHINMVSETLKLSLTVLDEPNSKLPMIIKEYLLMGSYNDQWGSILLKILLEEGSLTEEELFAINQNITDWGSIAKYCESSPKDSSRMIMDYAYRSYGDRDLICGYRMMITRSPEIQMALCNLQQR